MYEQPTLCLKCGNFPCTCGKQYANLTKKNFLTLLNNLSIIGKERNLFNKCSIKVDGQDVNNAILEIPDEVKTLFVADDLIYMPKMWVVYLKSSEIIRKPPRDLILKIAREKSTDDFSFPSGLIMALMLRAEVDTMKIVEILKHCLELSEYNISNSLLPLFNVRGGLPQTTLSNIRTEYLRMKELVTTADNNDNTVTWDGNFGQDLACLQSLYNLVQAIIERSAITSSYFLNRFMANLEGYGPDLTETVIWCDTNYDTNIFYIDEYFRRAVKELLVDSVPVANLPIL